ncbi:type I restriction endonuclease subunit R [Pseudoalteromonas sp. SR44-8]|uniref:type I restriction endonuclease subunit R n=1 Tax=Pseudoalteromonas sp. SR44-8 TaxID=2760933 RepID=UPI0016046435|nr:type I restriction endonuclease [Pseudoalteromonas sp. SR44-8]MBB1303037.1 type I restriction endonuclease subunit R [Pseudoalteromonas sp. SR44-8]
MKKHTEARFEDAIEACLLEQHKYQQGNSKDFDTDRALEPKRVTQFIESTQPKTWKALKAIHGEGTEDLVVETLHKELNTRGTLKVLRHGFKCYGKKVKMVFFAPNNHKNDDTWRLYNKNILSVTRQLYYSGQHRNSLDVVLFINGIPVVTMELKNELSGQDVEHAKRQYQNDRDHKELIFEFKKRTLVHFAVDTQLVFMATRLNGSKTFFLPFNKGCNHGAGNPENHEGDYKTAYLWQKTFSRDSMLDILGKFMHLQVEEKRVLTDKGIKKVTKETMIFPRFHQLDAVRSLVNHAYQSGPGHNYLVEHSAGSGKSNSIAWLAHRLSSLHNESEDRVFDSVIVVTDRRVLDQQLQNTIYQFEHKQGVVEKIDEDTRQLVNALVNSTPIIITTLQKFPFVTETIDKLNEENQLDGAMQFSTAGKNFAVIVDEAHSSQSGETAMELKGVLNKDGIKQEAAKYVVENDIEDEDIDNFEEVCREMMKRGKQPNISFFAFTATPKYKTKHVFNEPNPVTGEVPFHKYSMRQAIEEKFILDVLKNYTTYTAYFGIAKSSEDDPHVERKKAAKALARNLNRHPTNLYQKTEVMVEHFRQHVRHKIGGRAKAMVVTGSRLQAVEYKKMFDQYIQEKGYTDVKSLVAFSGSVEDPKIPGKEYTEVGLNEGIKESELPEQFDTDEYQLLLVAEKYQTGFDQPLLHTMYVDKKLSGIQAVQTLSRLNRMCAGKEDTFVLDFQNKRDDIFRAFKDFYEEVKADELTDPQHLYRLQDQINEQGIIFQDEVAQFCDVYFQPKRQETKTDHAKFNSILDKAISRFKELEEEEQSEFKGLLVDFRNMYAFMSQVIPYQDSDLEQLYTYTRFLLTKLPRKASGTDYRVEDDVELQYYRLQKISEGQINLNMGEANPLKGPSDVGTGQQGEDMIRLSELIDLLNDRFGTDFTQADQLFFDQIQQEAVESEKLQMAAHANNIDDFRYVFNKAFSGLVIDRMDGNEEIFNKLMGDSDFRGLASEHLLHRVYNSLKTNTAKALKPIPLNFGDKTLYRTLQIETLKNATQVALLTITTDIPYVDDVIGLSVLGNFQELKEVGVSSPKHLEAYFELVNELLPCLSESGIKELSEAKVDESSLILSLTSVSEGSSIFEIAVNYYQPVIELGKAAIDIGSGAISVAETGLTVAGAAALLQKPYKAIKEKLSRKMLDSEVENEERDDNKESKSSLIITEFNFQDVLKNRNK